MVAGALRHFTVGTPGKQSFWPLGLNSLVPRLPPSAALAATALQALLHGASQRAHPVSKVCVMENDLQWK